MDQPASMAIKKKCKSEARTRASTYIPAMVIGTGLDLVSVPRFDRFRLRHELRGLGRLFTPNELDYCLRLVKPTPSLAARFAAKEAFFKAAGTGLGRAGGWHDVEVLRLESGRPLLCLHSRAAIYAQNLMVRKIHLSLSHTDEVAGATVILEGG